MATPLSIHNLRDGGWRTVLSVSGICIAIILIFMQLGFLGAVLDTAVLFYNNLKFDLVVCSPDYYHFCDSNKFSRHHLDEIRNVDGVKSIEPYHISIGKWNYAEKSVQRGMLIMGARPAGDVFRKAPAGVVLPDLKLLTTERIILVDRKSRPKFLGDDNREGFTEDAIGLRVELNQKEVEIGGLFNLGTGLAANGASIIDERGFEKLFPNHSPGDVSLGLIQLDGSTYANLNEAREAIRRTLGMDSGGTRSPVDIMTLDELRRREVIHWITNTPVGFIFIAGVVIAFMVGTIIVYIVLSSDITKQIGQYATLKAMGYTPGYLSRVVLEQALLLGVVSYLIAYAISLVLYHVVGNAANLPITMTVNRQLIVFSATVLICCSSGAIAMQKLRKADPADLF